jgi:hypothetical protein
MYDLRVYHPGEDIPAKFVTAPSATEALDLIPKLLAEHDGCERVSVLARGTFLFSVDCKGHRMNRDKP